MPCPLCWLRVNGFPEIPEDDHGREWWDWLREHQDDPDVQAAMAKIPKGVLDTF